jgi:hypothetical protein
VISHKLHQEQALIKLGKFLPIRCLGGYLIQILLSDKSYMCFGPNEPSRLSVVYCLSLFSELWALDS